MSTEPVERLKDWHLSLRITGKHASLNDDNVAELIDLLDYAITHLSPTPCDCEAFNQSLDADGPAFTAADGIRFKLADLPPISFCPWCGHPVPKPETKAV